MRRFRYIGLGSAGRPVEGIISAPTEFEAEINLMNLGVLQAKLQPAFPAWKKLYFKHFCQSDITRVARQLNLLLRSGVSVHESLELAQNQTGDNDLKGILQDIILQVESGKSVSESLSRYPFLFDDMVTGAVEAGELSGTLDRSFEQIASFRERMEFIRRKAMSSLAYPMLVLVVAVLVVWAILYYVVPIFTGMYANMGAELPESTEVVVRISEFIRSSMLHVLVGLVVAVSGAVYMMRRVPLRIRTGKLLSRLPITDKIVTSIVTLRFSRTLGVLLLGGVDILRAVKIASRTTDFQYAERALRNVGDELMRGASLTKSLGDAQVFPMSFLRLTAVGERTGQLGEMLVRSAEYYESQAETQLSTLTSLIEPLLLIVLGCIVSAILVSMYLPLFDLANNL